MRILSIGIYPNDSKASPKYLLNSFTNEGTAATQQIEKMASHFVNIPMIDQGTLLKARYKNTTFYLNSDPSFIYVLATDEDFFSEEQLEDHCKDMREMLVLRKEDEIAKKLQDPFHISSKIYHVQKKLEETKKILCEDIDKLIERGEKIEDLLLKTEELTKTSSTFRTRAFQANPSFWRYLGSLFCFFPTVDADDEKETFHLRSRYHGRS